MTVSSTLCTARRWLRALLLGLLLAMLWWALTGGAGWAFGAPAVLAGVLVARALGPRATERGWRPWGLVRFLGFFLRESAAGGLDVAGRALHPRLPLELCWIDYALRLPPGPARLLFVASVSLLPGTLSAELNDNQVIIHSLNGDDRRGLERLERRVAALYGLSLG